MSDIQDRTIQPGISEQRATRAVFFVAGFGTASWAPLVPLLKERLGIAEDVLGLLLLCIGIGSLLTMPLSGAAAARLGCRRVLAAACGVNRLRRRFAMAGFPRTQ